jgi:hypothetical protein
MNRTLIFGHRPLTDAEAEALKDKPLDASHYDEVLPAEPMDVYKETGWPLLFYRPAAIDAGLAERARPAIRRAAKVSNNGGGRPSGLVGFYPRGWSWPYCRCTPFTRDDLEGWRALKRLFRAMDRLDAAEMPEVYQAQLRYAREPSPDFIVPGTVFTTGMANSTWAHPAHRHPGNLSLGASVMAVFRQGHYRGGLFVLPQYRIAADLRDRDVVLFDSRAWHGNTVLEPAGGDFERLSFVAYYPRKMLECGSALQENDRAKRRRPGK